MPLFETFKEGIFYKPIIWCPEVGSNHRHKDFQSFALPTELSGLKLNFGL